MCSQKPWRLLITKFERSLARKMGEREASRQGRAIAGGPALAGSILILTGVRVRPYAYLMRYSREHKAENHEKILSVAARSFRERGGDSSGIGTVMKKVGLKKGG